MIEIITEYRSGGHHPHSEFNLDKNGNTLCSKFVITRVI